MPSSTTCPHTNNYYYTIGSKNPGSLIGIKANIDTKSPKLQCESKGSTFASHSAAYAGVAFVGGYNVQTGWARYRISGSSTVQGPKMYLEGTGNTYHRVFGNAPTGSPEYKLEINTTTGTVSAYYDQSATPWATIQDDAWKQQASAAVYSGEIYVRETDMPGTSGSPCNFATCQYKQSGGSYTNAGFAAADVTSDDTTEWGADWISVSAFKIYDKKPI